VRAGLVAVVLAILGAATSSGLKALRRRRAPVSPGDSASVAATPTTERRAAGRSDTRLAAVDGALGSAAAAPVPAAPPLAILIPEGRTELGDSLFALRDGRTVTVHFDTPQMRTRRRDKFERVVRATLPRVYGAPADSLLAHIPMGSFAKFGDPATELPSRGIRLPLAAGWVLGLWPETRAGQDGPLVVAYRAALTR